MIKYALLTLVACGLMATSAYGDIVIDDNKKYPDHYTTGPSNDKLTTLRCPGRKVIIDYDIPSPGGAAGSDIIILNPKYMKSMPWQARLFMFAHECGHTHGHDDESAADRFAVKMGVEQGWLKEDMLDEICEDYGDAPASSDGHPSGRTRCLQNERWFHAEMKNAEEREPDVADVPDVTDAVKPLPEPTFTGATGSWVQRRWWWPF